MMKIFCRLAFCAAFASGALLRADQVAMQNGDLLNGTVLSVTTNTLVLQNDNLGKITLPRAKVANIILGTATRTAGSAAGAAGQPMLHGAVAATNADSDLAAAFRGLRGQTNLIQQVQSQFLASAGPGAVGKFNELLDGLSTGKIDLNDLRAQAQSAADQLHSLKQELGPDSSGEMDSYLAILNEFLQETAPASASTNASPAAAQVPAGP